MISYFNTMKNNEIRKIKQETVVSQLLPLHAFNKLKNANLDNQLDLTDEFKDVTILYADIAGFTSYSKSVKPEDVVFMLRSLFTEFDRVCHKYSAYKVYTIGDCYVAMGFIDSSKRNPTQEAFNIV